MPQAHHEEGWEILSSGSPSQKQSRAYGAGFPIEENQEEDGATNMGLSPKCTFLCIIE